MISFDLDAPTTLRSPATMAGRWETFVLVTEHQKGFQVSESLPFWRYIPAGRYEDLKRQGPQAAFKELRPARKHHQNLPKGPMSNGGPVSRQWGAEERGRVRPHVRRCARRAADQPAHPAHPRAVLVFCSPPHLCHDPCGP